MTSLLLRADGGPTIGVGHVARCLAFAEAAVARGWTVTFAGEAAWLADRFRALDVPVVPAADWAADVVLVDHYGLGELPETRGRVVSMEDGTYGRRAADVVVDPNLVLAPREPDGTGVYLGGPRYAPLRADVVAARRARSGVPGDPPRVVVVMGGGAAADTVAAAVAALRDTGLPMSVRAIAAGEVPLPPAGPGQHFAVGPPTPELPTLFAEADLVVSAAGVTLTELCCVGAPAALVQLVDNQATGYRAALSLGLAAGLGTPADLPAASADLRDLLSDPDRRAALAEAAAATVDGGGVDRVLDAATLTVREATLADARTLLAWRNDPDTRAWSRGSQPVAAQVHESWLRRTIADPDHLLLVVERDTTPLGTVRFDRIEPGTWEVSIVVAPEHRGHGLAGRILMVGQGALHARVGPATLLATVHEANTPSMALFRRAGYHPATRPAEPPFAVLERHSRPA
ncbi:bifunctional UDP-2,4-diacetamido-2,4,6-trideoxy-beta-L-altropyranose hydrolase/GNAT family N-acetyltransferase [Actinophytocola gossypii]|uniref:UDP-2,4-diacetamido-2,4, 6-trideoxy-beta-L-altropyranose hydrolase n=1 Tax=Actinophytocola gossypii TaxID=2812003 RepID=A0ABT2JLC1_9PSEU|nr:bifunctional UDP-2,4-diacetamido-2,4,6-trideoxy-beta-L-altropyranose hydrolase/GNAT family N-acetyltransferase [Actinophytocola gossypii]MCT2588304.1 UDP-2,4-diacetamido-2,4,6-trideoxy-beta-L-altropyranose hydrolase [Actinophytocola gossypii]